MKTAAERIKFRGRKEWKEFRAYLLEKEGNSCEMCGQNYKGKNKKKLQVHHLKPYDYTNLNEFDFKLVCCECHKLIERFMIKKTWGKHSKKWESLLKNFLPKEGEK